MHHLYTIQGTKHLQYFLVHIACNNGNGNLTRICLEHTQLEVGTYEPFIFLKYSSDGTPSSKTHGAQQFGRICKYAKEL
jgi:hypothetical protein